MADGTDDCGGDDGASVELTPWNSVQYFLEVARKGTLARASRRLGVSHTTVLRQIAKLERAVDAKLFERDSTGYKLTVAGEELLERAEGMGQIADELFRSSKAPDLLSGPVRVAAIEGLAAYVLTPAFAGFGRQYPEITIELISMLHSINVNFREADITVGPSKPSGQRLTTKHLAACPIHLYAARSYLDEFGVPDSIQSLERHRFVDYVEDLVELPELNWFRESVGRRVVAFRSTTPMIQLEAVRNGIGIGMFPDYLVASDEQLVAVIPEQVGAERNYWLAMHSDLWRVPRMQTTAHFIAATLAKEFGDGRA